MRATDCSAAYKQGMTYAQSHRRSAGAYKLRQRYSEWLDSEAEVRRISRCIRNPDARHYLRHCTYEDKALWIRKILISYAYELSADIFPSFEALIGDGLNEAQIKAVMPAVRQACVQSVEILESARHTVSGDIAAEYQRMQLGESVVESALSRVRGLIGGCISELPVETQATIW